MGETKMGHSAMGDSVPCGSPCYTCVPVVCGTHFTTSSWFDPLKDPEFHREGIYSTHTAQLAQGDTSSNEENQDSPQRSNSLTPQPSAFAPSYLGSYSTYYHWVSQAALRQIAFHRGDAGHFIFPLRPLEKAEKTFQRRQISRIWTWTRSKVWTGRTPTCSWDQKSLKLRPGVGGPQDKD